MSELVGKIQSDETLSSQEKDDWILIAREVFEQVTVNTDSPQTTILAKFLHERIDISRTEGIRLIA